MTNTVIANGNTYTDDDDPNTGMGAGGFRERLLPMLSDVMHDTEIAMTGAQGSASSAATSAASAVSAPGTSATSTSSVVIGTGSKSFTIQAGKSLVVGAFLVLADTTAPSTRWMFGQITAYNSGTGALTMSITRIQGSGTVATWTISLAAPGSRDTGGASTVSGTLAFAQSAFKYQESTGYTPYRESRITGSSAGVPGPGIFAIRNTPTLYASDLYVYDQATLTMNGFLPPNRVARVDARADNSWQSGDLRPYGSDLKTTVTFSSAVAGTGGLWTKAVQNVDGSTTVFVHGASLHAVYFDANGVAGSPLLIRSGLSTAGGEATVAVMPLRDGSKNVLVASCPDSGTALQQVILIVDNFGALSLGTMVPTTLGTAAVRLFDIRQVPNSAGNLTFVVTALGSTTTLQNYGVVVSATTITVGAVRNDTTTASFGCIVVLPNAAGNDIYISLSSTATVLSAKAVTINPTTGTQTLGTTATTTVSSASNILVREVWHSPSVLPSEAVVVFTNTLPKASLLTASGTVPSFGSQVALTSAITTATSYSASAWLGFIGGTAVSGTDSSGRFLTEVRDWDQTLTAFSAFRATYMSATHTAAWVGQVYTSPPSVVRNQWQLLSATEIAMVSSGDGLTFPAVQRYSGLGVYAQPLAAVEANYPRYARARTVMSSSSRALCVTDGSKPSVLCETPTAHMEGTPMPFSLINQLSFSHLIEDSGGNGTLGGLVGSGVDYGYAWLAAGPAPSTEILIQRARLV